mmetsp:Transcript_27990/g.43079  ORF Transcript_27990/g.43079 Transcript_27990/m.43079 type:complete len:136 (-) Transcript_27990:1805-2212(-)
MKFSNKILWNLKNKNKKLKPNIYKKLKRESLRGFVKGTASRPRLTVYRSNNNIYAQIINDEKSITLAACSTLDRDSKIFLNNGRTYIAAEMLGKKIAEVCLKKNIKTVIFDRNTYIYHGRIKAIATSARKYGLEF